MSDEAVVTGGNEVIGESIATENVASESAPVSSRHKVKVDGEELELELDEILKGYQKSASSDKRFQEASRKEKMLQQALSEAKSNPRKFFELAGLDAKQFAEALLVSELEESLLTPEDKQSRAEKAELEAYKKEKAERLAAQQKVEQERSFSQAAEQIENEIIEALNTSGMKPTAKTIARIAEQMLASLDENGTPRVKAPDALKRVKNDYAEELKDFISGQSTPEALLAMLPKEIIEGLRQTFVKSVQTNGFNAPQKASVNGQQVGQKRTMEIDDLFN